MLTEEILLISFVVASVSYTVTDALVFKPFREWTEKRSHVFGKLFSCGYCLSHWISFFMVWLFEIDLFISGYGFIDFFLSAIAIVWIAAFQWIIFSILMKLAGK
jgi:hypothetical protein